MRRFALFLFLAGSALPALAAVDDEDRRPQRHNNSTAERSESVQRPSRAERMEARREAFEARRAAGGERDGGETGVARRSFQRQAIEQQQQQQQQPAFQRQAVEQQGQDRNFRRQWQRRFEGQAPVAGGSETIVPRQREIRTIPDSNPTQQVGTRHRDRQGYDGRHAGRHRDWTRDWRSDRRYDWRRWRERNRTRFHLGFYFDPFGWNYRRYSIGSYLYPSYYSSRYWLDDPWSYRLPPAWGPYRWVRYHNDALLIDTWTGEVVDVIYNFFW